MGLAASEGSWKGVVAFFRRQRLSADPRTTVKPSTGADSGWVVAVDVFSAASVVATGRVPVFFSRLASHGGPSSAAVPSLVGGRFPGVFRAHGCKYI